MCIFNWFVVRTAGDFFKTNLQLFGEKMRDVVNHEKINISITAKNAVAPFLISHGIPIPTKHFKKPNEHYFLFSTKNDGTI